MFYGLAAEYTGRAELAQEIDLRLQELDDPMSRAYLSAARGDAEAAVRLLNEVFDRGTSRVGMRSAFLHESPEFMALGGNPSFDQLAAPRG